MHCKTDEKRFVSTYCGYFAICCIFVALSLLIYFLLPSNQPEQKVIAEIPVEVMQEPEEPEMSQAFQEYLADVTYDKLNNDIDSGLLLYRDVASRAAVEWFYSHITGSKEIAQAILSSADLNDIPISLAFSLAYVESRYNAKAIHNNSNNTVDRGLFQLNSNTFPGLTETDFYDPFISSKYGMSHLKFCLNTAGNSVSALAMYNAGTTRVRTNKTPQTTLNYVGSILTYQKMLDSLFEQEVASYYGIPLSNGFAVAYNKTAATN